MTDRFNSIVYNFLNSDIEFALMVNGDWGKGKTHYFKKQFSEDFDGKKVIYSSVFGIKDMKEIDDAIVYEKLKLKGKLGEIAKNPNTKVVTSIGKTIGKSLLKKYVGLSDDDLETMNEALDEVTKVDISEAISLSENEILIIDDIERLDSNITYQDLFGYISANYCESGIKVILLCHEGYIHEMIKDEVRHKEPYDKFKEKVVWRTIHFELDLMEVMPSFYDKYDEPFKTYLNDRHDFLLDMCQSFRVQNLRTLRFFIETFRTVYNTDPQFFNETDSENIVFTSVFILSDYYKSGYSLRDENSKLHKFLFDDGQVIRTDLFTESDETNPAYEKANSFNSKYLTGRFKYKPLKSVMILIDSGFLHEPLVKKELEGLKQYYSKDHSWVKCLDLYCDPFSIDGVEERRKNEEKVMEHLKEGRYDLNQIKKLIHSHEIWIKEGIDFTNKSDKLYDLLNQTVEKAEEIGDMIFGYPSLEKSKELKFSDDYCALTQRIDEKMNNIFLKNQHSRIEETLSNLEGTTVLTDDTIRSILGSSTESQINRLAQFISLNNKNILQFSNMSVTLAMISSNSSVPTFSPNLTLLLNYIEQNIAGDDVKIHIYKKAKEEIDNEPSNK